MWVWSLNWDEIRRDILIGSCPRTNKDLDRIRDETKATALLSVQSDACRAALKIDYDALRRHAKGSGLVLKNAPMRDFDPCDQRNRLVAAVGTLHRLIAANHRVYVHCTAGINRAPLTVLGYLTFVETKSAEAAMQLIRRGRAGAEPYWDSYHGCRQDLVERHRAAIERLAYAESQRKPERSTETNWLEAEKAVIRALFVEGMP